MEPSTSDDRSGAGFGARVLLGLFIVWQLYFLAAHNFLEPLLVLRGELARRDDGPRGASFREVSAVTEPVAPGLSKERGQVNDTLEVLGPLTRRYAQITGQTQSWSLFAPDVSRQCLFPCVELHWDDEPPRLLLSENEPADVQQFFRAGKSRIRRYERHACLDPHICPAEAGQERPEEWNEQINALLRQEGDAILAYLRWRVAAFLEANPGTRIPTQVVLIMRRYRINGPDEAPPYVEGPSVETVARWRPAVGDALEAYDHASKRFEARGR